MRRIGKKKLYDVEDPLPGWGCGAFRSSVMAAPAEAIVSIFSRPHRYEKFQNAQIRLYMD